MPQSARRKRARMARHAADRRSVLTFTSAKTDERQTFAAAPDAPVLAKFVRVIVYDRRREVHEVALESEAWGPKLTDEEQRMRRRGAEDEKAR